jgi:hypothetical protein
MPVLETTTGYNIQYYKQQKNSKDKHTLTYTTNITLFHSTTQPAQEFSDCQYDTNLTVMFDYLQPSKQNTCH